MNLSVDRHQPRCGRCGAPTQPQTIKGMSALVCVACGAVTVDQQTLQRLTGATPSPGRGGPQPSMLDGGGQPSSFSAGSFPGGFGQPTPGGAGWHGGAPPFGIDPSREPSLGAPVAPPKRRTGRILLAVVAAGLVLLVLAAPASYLVYLGVAAYEAQRVQATRPVALVPATAGVSVEEPEVEPDVAPEAAEAPPTPPPPAEPAPPVGFDGLLQRGWQQVERHPTAAAATFREALDQRPEHPEASYGLGYAHLKLGDRGAARPWLCAARSGSDPEVVRDVRSLLAQNGLTCQ